MPDKILLRGLRFYGYHGRHAEERALGQPFLVDIDAELDLSAAGRSDDIADSVSYTDLYRIARKHMESASHLLVESLAEAIAQEALSECAIDAVRVRVIKQRPPIKGATLDGAGVEVYRRRPAC